MKGFLLVGIAVALLGIVASAAAVDFSGTMGQLVGVSVFAVVSFFLLFVLCVLGAILLVYWMAWLHRAEKNLRIVGQTEFLPALAVICTCIPFLGPIIHFFIFRDLVEQQRIVMEKFGILKETISRRFQVAWIAFGICSIAFTFLADYSSIFSACSFACFLAATIAYLRCFEIFIKQEAALFRFNQEDEFQKKVNAAIREREILKAASQVEQAKFD